MVAGIIVIEPISIVCTTILRIIVA